MKTSAKLEVQLIVAACKKVGITKVVISPGSRNAPFSIAFDEDPDFEVFVITDERSAAFYAMGMAQKLNKPVAIACTSGSAPLNYFPAIAEAYYQQIPLVVITADRPQEWIDQGDGQTIQQNDVFGKHVLACAQLNPIFSNDQRWMFERQLAATIQQANGKIKGPVHLNVPLSEPLYETVASSETFTKWIQLAQDEVRLSEQDKAFVFEQLASKKKRLLIIGQQQHDEKTQLLVNELLKDGSVAVLVEHTSNIQSEYAVQCIDRSLNLIKTEELATYYPDIIISIGGAIISKRIKRFLRAANAPVIRFGAAFPIMDTFQHLVFSSTTNAYDGLSVVLSYLNTHAQESRFGFHWKALDYQSEIAAENTLQSIPFSDLKVMEELLDVIPDNAHIHLSNSSIIRYALLFNPVKGMRYWCNRGTSGIDGSTSTAAGIALLNQSECHVLITGDLSFFYDSNALWNAHLPENLRIVVLNNGGGDIFNIIPGPKTTNQHERIFLAQHNYSAEYICKTFDVSYQKVTNEETLSACWSGFFAHATNGRPKLIEVMTAGVSNSEWLDYFFDQSKQLIN
jgi:2-succinyl-5-enolpyruvyl-6-hydroxy-3-cyclohexene-1-carboxylate synthase